MHSSKKSVRHVFIGTQGSGSGAGIHHVLFDEERGTIGAVELAAEIDRPTWLLADRVASRLFAVSEVGNAGDREGAVASFEADGGRLRQLSCQPSGGGGATHLALASDRKTLFVANFGGGQIGALPVDDGGMLGAVERAAGHQGSGPHRRQQGPHPHGVTIDPTGRFVLAPDMGGDRVFIHGYDPASGRWMDAAAKSLVLPAGSGPRLLIFGASGAYAYLLTELSAEIVIFRCDNAAALTQIGCVNLDKPGSDHPPSAAAIVLSGDGRQLYASNRGTNEILLFDVDPESGLLTEAQRVPSAGLKPWHVELSLNGKWLFVANQASDNVSLFAIDPRNGRMTPTDRQIAVPSPTGIAIL